MNKIKFEDGKLKSSGYIEIDGIKHEIIEAEYEGTTPLSSFVMNKLQDNIEEDINKVESNQELYKEKIVVKNNNEIPVKLQLYGNSKKTERTEKNKYDVTKIYTSITNKTIDEKTGTIQLNFDTSKAISVTASCTVQLEPNTSYYINYIYSGNKTGYAGTINNYLFNETTKVYDYYNNQKKITTNSTGKVQIILIGCQSAIPDANYCKWTGLQLEKGSVATDFEQFGNEILNCKDNININISNTNDSNETNYLKRIITFPLESNQQLMLGDYLGKDGIYHVRKRFVIDGTETIYSVTLNNNLVTFNLQKSGLPGDYYTDTLLRICNRFNSEFFRKWSTLTDIITTVGIAIFKDQFKCRTENIFGINSSDSLELMKTKVSDYLKNNNIIFEVAQNWKEIYTDAQRKAYAILENIELFKDYNYIYSTDELPCFMQATNINLNELKTNISVSIEFKTGRIIDNKEEFGKRISTGKLPASGEKYIETGLSNVTQQRPCTGVVGAIGQANYDIPFALSSTNCIYARLSASGNQLAIRRSAKTLVLLVDL